LDSFTKVFTGLSRIAILKKAFTVLGCVLFVVSSIFPFYTYSTGNELEYSVIRLWSFRNDSRTYNMLGESVRNQLSLFNYWFSSHFNLSEVRISWVLPLLFVIQVLTLAFGVTSLIFKKRILSFAPVLLNLTAILLMMYTNWVVNPSYPSVITGWYQLGYYLVYASLVAFLLASY